MTPPHPDAVGSYGEEAIAWFEEVEGIKMRWWQKLAITRQLEFDVLGQLVWRTVVESGPRRIGKSVRLRGLALWRVAHGSELFGEPRQLVIHTGKDVNIVKEIQRRAWPWAESVAGWKVSKANGNEALQTPDDDRWLSRAMNSVYGYDVMLGMVDEAWAVDPGAVDEGLEPAMLERLSPQLHLTSTAHRKATSLMKRRISDAMSIDDGKTLLMLWAAPPGSDPGDPVAWRAASAHWSEDREETIRVKYAKALAGDLDPELDDPDPMAGFTSQYLNMWRLREVSSAPGFPLLDEATWTALRADLPSSQPEAVAVEGWPGEGISIAVAHRVENLVVVSVREVEDVASAAVWVAAAGCARPAIVGASLLEDPSWKGIRTTSQTGTSTRMVADVALLLAEGVLRHDGGDYLTGQLLGLRTTPGTDGPKVTSKGRADAVKAAVWAAQSARRKGVGKPRVVFV